MCSNIGLKFSLVHALTTLAFPPVAEQLQAGPLGPCFVRTALPTANLWMGFTKNSETSGETLIAGIFHHGSSFRRPAIECVDIYMGVSINGVSPKSLFLMENPIQMDDLGVPPFQETSVHYMCFPTWSISELATHTSHEPPKPILDPVVRHEPSTEHGATTSVGSFQQSRPSNMKYTTRNPGI